MFQYPEEPPKSNIPRSSILEHFTLSGLSCSGTFLYNFKCSVELAISLLRQSSVPHVSIIKASRAGVNMWTPVSALSCSSYRAGLLNHSWPGRIGGCRQADLVQCLTGCLLIYWVQQRYRNTIHPNSFTSPPLPQSSLFSMTTALQCRSDYLLIFD